MNNLEKNNEALTSFAVKIERYVSNDPNVLERFRDGIKPFAQRWADYEKAIQESQAARISHWEIVKKKPELQDKARKPAGKKWEWDPFYLFHLPCGPDEKVQPPLYFMPAKLVPEYLESLKKHINQNKKKLGILDQKTNDYGNLKDISEQETEYENVKMKYDGLPEEQRETARIRAVGNWHRYISSNPDDDEKWYGCWRPPLIQIPESPLTIFATDYTWQNEKEEYERYYIALSCVHDKYCPDKKPIARGIWPEQLFYQVQYLLDKSIPKLEDAFEKVKKAGQIQKSVDNDEIEILNYINDKYPENCTIEKIAVAIKRTRNTTKNKIDHLKELGFLCIPPQKKRGIIITNEGIEYFKKHFAAE
jgi:hypothetical protein